MNNSSTMRASLIEKERRAQGGTMPVHEKFKITVAQQKKVLALGRKGQLDFYDQPTIAELEKIIENCEKYKKSPDNKWYHSVVILKESKNKPTVYCSRNDEDDSITYQKLVEKFTKVNTNITHEPLKIDNHGGVLVFFS